MLLEVKSLCTEFPVKRGVVRAVDDVTFSVDEGEILAIVGESGSGKSVTSLSIMGLLAEPGHVAGGSMEFDGKDLTTLSEKEYREMRGNDMAMIFQEPMTSLNPVYRIGDQIVEAIRTHEKISKKEALTRAIDLLRRLRDDTGMAVLLITHDLGVVSETADRVVVMYCGQVVEEAEVRSLFDNPMHPYTLGLLKSIPRLEDDDSKRLYMIKGMVPNPLEMPPGCHFSDRCDNCMQICREKVPDLVQVGDHKVRCFLYEEESGKAKNAAEVEKNEEKARAAVEAAREVSTAAALIMGDETQEAEEGKADER